MTELIFTDKFPLNIMTEMYFPLVLSTNECNDNILHCGWYCGDSDLFEISADRSSGTVTECVLTLCRHFAVIDAEYSFYPAVLPENTAVSVLAQPVTQCSRFKAEVYRNGVFLILSSEAPAGYEKIGQTVLGLTPERRLVSLFVTGMTPEELAHTVEELNYDIS